MHDEPDSQRPEGYTVRVKSQQTDKAFKWELQFLANDKSCITQRMAQKNISAFMALKMFIFLRKKVCYY